MANQGQSVAYTELLEDVRSLIPVGIRAEPHTFRSGRVGGIDFFQGHKWFGLLHTRRMKIGEWKRGMPIRRLWACARGRAIVLRARRATEGSVQEDAPESWPFDPQASDHGLVPAIAWILESRHKGYVPGSLSPRRGRVSARRDVTYDVELEVVYTARLPWEDMFGARPHKGCIMQQAVDRGARSGQDVAKHVLRHRAKSGLDQCAYHRLPWLEANDLAIRAFQGSASRRPSDVAAALPHVLGLEDDDQIQDLALCLINDPIKWTPGRSTDGGRHRLCVLRTSGARAILVQAAHARWP